MRRVLAVLFLATSVNLSIGQAPRVDRYWGQFEIARIQLTAEPFDGGAGSGLFTDWVPIFAQAVVRVEEAQNFTWEWLGVSAPGEMSLAGFPNLTFEGFSDNTVEYRDLTMDLNPIAPNEWGSAEIFDLPYPSLTIAGSYQSFSTQTDFNADYTLRMRPNDFSFPGNPSPQAIDYYFRTVVSRVNFSQFPDELVATIQADARGLIGTQGYNFPSNNEVVLEPKLRLGRIQLQQFRHAVNTDSRLLNGFADVSRRFTLIHTPTGDANNDGTVGFDDFLILSAEFGLAEAARWEDGDFDGDGAVGFADFLGLSANFGLSTRLNAEPVPEPSGLWLGISTILILWRRRSDE